MSVTEIEDHKFDPLSADAPGGTYYIARCECGATVGDDWVSREEAELLWLRHIRPDPITTEQDWELRARRLELRVIKIAEVIDALTLLDHSTTEKELGAVTEALRKAVDGAGVAVVKLP